MLQQCALRFGVWHARKLTHSMIVSHVRLLGTSEKMPKFKLSYLGEGGGTVEALSVVVTQPFTHTEYCLS